MVLLTLLVAIAVSTVFFEPRGVVDAQTEAPTFIEFDETWWPTPSSEVFAIDGENGTNATLSPTTAPTEFEQIFPAPTTPFPSVSPTSLSPTPKPTTAKPSTAQPATSAPATSAPSTSMPSTSRPQGGGSGGGSKKKGGSNDSTVMIAILVVVIVFAIFAAMCCAIVVLRKREKQAPRRRPDGPRYATPSSGEQRPISTGSYCDVDDEGRSVRRTTTTTETADLSDAFFEDEDAISMTSITSDKMEPALRRLIHQEEGMLQDAHEIGMENVLRPS